MRQIRPDYPQPHQTGQGLYSPSSPPPLLLPLSELSLPSLPSFHSLWPQRFISLQTLSAFFFFFSFRTSSSRSLFFSHQAFFLYSSFSRHVFPPSNLMIWCLLQSRRQKMQSVFFKTSKRRQRLPSFLWFATGKRTFWSPSLWFSLKSHHKC